MKASQVDINKIHHFNNPLNYIDITESILPLWIDWIELFKLDAIYFQYHRQQHKNTDDIKSVQIISVKNTNITQWVFPLNSELIDLCSDYGINNIFFDQNDFIFYQIN